MTYKDTPPADASIQYKERDISGGSATTGDPAAEAAAEKYPVVMYSTPSCTPCVAARAYLQSRNVPFQDKNVDGNGELQQELKKKAGEISVPTILIGSKVMRGYVQSVLAGELDAAGYPNPGSPGSGQSQEGGQSSENQTGEPDQGEQDTFFKDQESAEQ